jgi:uncharacterized protein YfdQ (DUF2303 family)
MIQEILNALRTLTPQKISGTNAVVIDGGQRVHSLFEQDDALKAQAGWVKAESLASFAKYANDHALEESAVFASLEQNRLEAIIDWNNPQGAVGGMARHRCQLELKFTPNWLAWFSLNGKQIAQVAFAEFIEEHLDDVIDPAAATLLEVVTTLSGKRNVNFKNVVRLGNGDTGIQWEETTQAKAGETGELAIPSEITLELPIYRGCEVETTFRIRTLFRYRIHDGRLAFEIKMLGIEQIRDDAFKAVLEELGKVLAEGIPLFSGSVTKSPIAATTNLS